jgi:hypothetical protein
MHGSISIGCIEKQRGRKPCDVRRGRPIGYNGVGGTMGVADRPTKTMVPAFAFLVFYCTCSFLTHCSKVPRLAHTYNVISKVKPTSIQRLLLKHLLEDSPTEQVFEGLIQFRMTFLQFECD